MIPRFGKRAEHVRTVNFDNGPVALVQSERPNRTSRGGDENFGLTVNNTKPGNKKKKKIAVYRYYDLEPLACSVRKRDCSGREKKSASVAVCFATQYAAIIINSATCRGALRPACARVYPCGSHVETIFLIDKCDTKRNHTSHNGLACTYENVCARTAIVTVE